MRKIKADVQLCTGCQICSLACSYEIYKAFNPRKAKIVIHQDLIGIARNIGFIDHCDVGIPSACGGATDEPPCTSFCCSAALQLKQGG